MDNNSINVYGYIRVSTELQAKKGYSLAEQQAEIEKYCSSKGYNLVKVFSDRGVSGAKAVQRIFQLKHLMPKMTLQNLCDYMNRGH